MESKEQQILQRLIGKFRRDFGLNGANYITDTAAHAGDWMAIQAAGDAPAVFTTLTTAKGDDMDGLTIAAGQTIVGTFTDIQLTSGEVIAHKADPV